ncbi:LysE family translocator [Comamonas denitrificans]|uniref:LysE family translocator n=1 Tax=Comamonas denitrificans TaxID=117506 RepID=UPI001B73CC8B|nr:LysE family translocator [Comamonas sp.]
MLLSLWLLYVSLAAALIASPGPSALLCVSHALAHGARKTIGTILGGITASMTLMLLSALGLGAIIAASDTLFSAIKWAGAVYLLYLGISTWRNAKQAPVGVEVDTEVANAGAPERAEPADTTTFWTLFRKGLMVGLGNPKDLLFFSALFPQFMDASAPVAGQLLILGCTWMVLDGSIMLMYVLAGAKLLARLHGTRAGQWFDRATGGAFIAAAGILATSQR